MMKDDRKGYIIAGVLGFLTYFVGKHHLLFFNSLITDTLYIDMYRNYLRP